MGQHVTLPNKWSRWWCNINSKMGEIGFCGDFMEEVGVELLVHIWVDSL